MIEEAERGPPHGILIAAVVILIVSAPMLIGDGEAITEAIADMLSPIGLLLLPIILLLTIQFLSSDRASFLSSFFSVAGGEPDSIHRASGSPVGVGLVLIIVLFLVYYRVSLFGGDDDSGD